MELNITPGPLADAIVSALLNSLRRGLFVADASVWAELATQRDPLLSRFVLRLSRDGYKLVRSPFLDNTVVHIVTDTRLASEIFEHSFSPLGFGAGLLKWSMFRTFAPEYVSASNGWLWLKRRKFHEAMFGWTPDGGGCPVPDALRWMPSAPSASFFTDGAFGVIRRCFSRYIAQHRANLPRCSADFAQMRRLASLTVFGVDRADLLVQVLRRCQSVRALIGYETVPLGLQREYWQFVDNAVRRPLPDTLVEAAEGPAFAHNVGQDEVANQVVVWFFQLCNVWCVLLPIALAILAIDTRTRALLDAEWRLDSAFSVSSEDSLLNAVVLEVMRLYTPVFFLERRVTRPVTLSGFTFQPGQQLFLPLSAYLRDPRCFPRPNRFEPQRWLDDPDSRSSSSSRTRCCPTVFGLGAQACPARRVALYTMRYAVHALLTRHNYRLKTVPFPKFDLNDMPALLNFQHISFH